MLYFSSQSATTTTDAITHPSVVQQLCVCTFCRRLRFIEKTKMNYQRIFAISVAVTFLLTCMLSVAYGEEDYNAEAEVTDEDGDLPEEEVLYSSPKPSGNYYFAETFDDLEAFKRKWVVSDAKKEDTDENIAKYNGQWDIEPAYEHPLKNDYGLVLKSKAKHHAIAAELDKPFHFTDKPFIIQYEVNFQNGQECGGAYLKLLSQAKKFELRTFHDKTPYTIMFGPDKCGLDSKLHFIFKHRNPKNGTVTEKHSKKPTGKLDDYFKDKKPHLYTLVINPDNTFEVLVDNTLVNSGNLLEDFTPAVNPPMEIDDPNDKRPDGWDEREKIPDPDAKKPDDWDEDAARQIPDTSAVKPSEWNEDEPETIPDPNAEKPSDWDEEMDGDWEPPLINNPNCGKAGCGEWKPPLIDNPAYKGKWYSPLIENPNFKGKWKPRKIPNPDYYEDSQPFKMTSIGAVGIELWSMSDGIYFDNILITDDRNVAFQWAAESWQLKLKSSGSDEGVFTRILQYTNSHPWLWAVYIVAIGLPVVLLVVFCCSSSEDKEEKRRSAEAKKTDAPTADDDDPNAAENVEPTADAEDEVEEIDVVGENEDDVSKEETPENDNSVESEPKQEVAEEDMHVEGETEEPAEVPTAEESREHVGRSPRRRKPRKE